MKKSVVLLAAHEPSRDPRLDWIARFAAASYDVVVFGLAEPGRPRAAREETNGYRIVRTAHLRGSKRDFLAALLPVLVPSRIARRLLGAAALALAVILWPLAFLAEVIWRALRWLAGRTLTNLWTVRMARGGARRFLARRRSRAAERPASRLRTFAQTVAHFGRAARTFFIAVRAGPRPDVIHANDLDSLLGAVALKQVLGCRIIYDAHEFYPYSDPGARWWEVAFWRVYEKRLLRHVDSAFTVNPLLARQMQQAYGVDFGSVPNCEPLAEGLTEPAAHARAARAPSSSAGTDGVADDRVRFLFQGNFAPQRGLEELLRAWAGVDGQQAVLILRGPDSPAKRACVALAEELDLLNRSVLFAPPVREEELVAAAAQADVGLIPYLPLWLNYRFACPNKLSQYMQAGLAILANDLDFVRSVVESYQCGLIYRADDPASIVAAVRRLTEDEPFRRRCQENARRAVLSEYHWQKQSEPLYRAYARCAAPA